MRIGYIRLITMLVMCLNRFQETTSRALVDDLLRVPTMGMVVSDPYGHQ